MKILLTVVTFAALIVPPLPAGAQIHPERVRTLTRVSSGAPGVERHQRGQEAREQQTERFTRTVRIGADGALDLSNVAGDIAITRTGGSEVTIEVVKTARGRSADDAREQLALVQVDITERGGRAEVRTRYARGEQMRDQARRNISVSVAYTVAAPERTRITAKSVSGSISARDIRGDLALETVSGDVRIANAGRVPIAKSISGNVEVTDTTVEGSMEASTVSGHLTLRKVTARRLNLGSISGNVIIEDVDCELIDARSVSGDIRFAGPLGKGGRYDMRSHSGDVRVVVAGTTGFAVDASTFSGAVRTDLPLVVQGGTDRGPGRGQRTLRGTYGDASAVLALASFSGSIVIEKR